MSILAVKFVTLFNRGGVEDTRLEAKARNSPSENRPSRSQGQECSRPRTKDTGASVFQKKKVPQKIFSDVLQKRVLQKDYFLGILQKRKKTCWQTQKNH